MYCIKVPEGRERKVAGNYLYAFLPSYTCLKPLNLEKTEFGTERKLIVPGYIFTIRNERTAEHVPGGEWQIIEALSDPNPSFINEGGQIVSGPLAKCNHLVTDVKDDNVRIQANLLEQDRIYWIRVRKAAEEAIPPKAEEPVLQTQDTEKEPAPIVQEAAETSKAEMPVRSPDLNTAEIENANLKKKIALLEKEIRKLQSTLKELTS